MPIKNMYSFEPGECLAAEWIAEHLGTGCRLYFPIKDKGVDLLVERKGRTITVQVKESRYYEEGTAKGYTGFAFHQMYKHQLESAKGQVDFFVFLTYLPVESETGKMRFTHRYLVVPTSELAKRAVLKNTGSSKKYRFYFHYGDNEIIDIRDTSGVPRKWKDYTKFDDAWTLMKRALSR